MLTSSLPCVPATAEGGEFWSVTLPGIKKVVAWAVDPAGGEEGEALTLRTIWSTIESANGAASTQPGATSRVVTIFQVKG